VFVYEPTALLRLHLPKNLLLGAGDSGRLHTLQLLGSDDWFQDVPSLPTATSGLHRMAESGSSQPHPARIA